MGAGDGTEDPYGQGERHRISGRHAEGSPGRREGRGDPEVHQDQGAECLSGKALDEA